MRGYGTHSQPPGTWSDDTSLTLCTIDTLVQYGEDYEALGQSFLRWRRAENWTPHGRIFDIGYATDYGIRRIAAGTPPLEAGRDDEKSNGNGSLRILPAALWFAGRGDRETIEVAHRFSALTHWPPAPRPPAPSFCRIVQRLVAGMPLDSAIDDTWGEAVRHYYDRSLAPELVRYSRISPASQLRPMSARKCERLWICSTFPGIKSLCLVNSGV